MKYLLLFGALYLNMAMYSQDNKAVSIVVIGHGKSQDDAVKSALRSAIEQSFGTYISSETVISNDEFISDNITSLSQGSVLSYELLSKNHLPDSSLSLTIRAVVSLTEMQKLTESKGHTTTIAGGLFGANLKLAELQSNSEIKVVSDMTKICKQILEHSIDYNLVIDAPKKSDIRNDLQGYLSEGHYANYWPRADSLIVDNIYKIKLTVECKPNSNLDVFIDYFLNTLNTIKMSDSEIDFAKTSGTEYFTLRHSTTGSQETICLRSKGSVKLLEQLFDEATLNLLNYKVVSNDEIVNFSPINQSISSETSSSILAYLTTEDEDMDIHVIDSNHYALTLGLLNSRKVDYDRELDKKYPSNLEEYYGVYSFNLYKTDSDALYTRDHQIYHFTSYFSRDTKLSPTKGYMNVRYQVIDYYMPLKDVQRLQEIKVVKNY
jgi:hypothetical protein